MSELVTDQTPAVEAGLTRAQRLDRLPMSREHRRLVLGSGAGWALDAMDVGLISFVMVALAREWGLTPTTLSWIASIGFLGMAVGAAAGGSLADRVGRRRVFAATLVVYGVATGLAALSWSVGALLVFRFLIGVGLGAELPVASTLVSEFAPARVRARLVVALEAFWAVGWILAALIGYFVVAQGEGMWRWAFAIGALPALYAVVVRRTLPESVRFLELQRPHRGGGGDGPPVRGRRPAWSPCPLPPPSRRTAPARARCSPPGTRGRTAALWAVWFATNAAYYGVFIWLPALLVADGFSLVRSFGYTLGITLAQLPGYLAAAVLVETWGRRPTLALFLTGSAGARRAVRLGEQRHGGRAVRLPAVVLQPRRVGGAVRADPRGLPDPAARDRFRLGRGLRPVRLDPGAAGRAAAAGRGREHAGVRRVRRRAAARRGRGGGPAGAARGGAGGAGLTGRVGLPLPLLDPRDQLRLVSWSRGSTLGRGVVPGVNARAGPAVSRAALLAG